MSTKQTEPPTLANAHFNPALDKYDNVVLFPEKVAQAKANFQKVGMPKPCPAAGGK